jgi:small GTP-binding protein
MQRNVEKKVCLLGDWGVGKTSLIRRFVYNAYDDRYLSTLGVKVSKKEIMIKDFKKKPFLKVNLTLLIWDLVGQRGFHSMQASAYKGTNGALIVCDLTRPDTIESLEWWASSLNKDVKQIPVIFLTNKADLIRNDIPRNQQEMIRDIAAEYDARFFATSAKTGMNVEDSFNAMARMLTDSFFE